MNFFESRSPHTNQKKALSKLKKNFAFFLKVRHSKQGKLNIAPGRISTVGPGENLGRFFGIMNFFPI
jgi:hypothetical protein